MKGKPTPKEIIKEVLLNRENGCSTYQIAKKFSINRQTVANILKRYKFYDGAGWQNLKDRPVVEIDPSAATAVPSPQRNGKVAPPIEEPTDQLSVLKRFSSRLLIKELYSRGYRIEKDGLFFIEKKKVVLNDIINNA